MEASMPQQESKQDQSMTQPAGSTQSSTSSQAGGNVQGMTPNTAAALSYVLGFITGIIFLLIEKKNDYVRFHATQSTITFIAIAVVNVAVGWLFWPLVTLVNLASFILWIVLIYKAYQGERFSLPIIGPLAEQYKDKVK